MVDVIIPSIGSNGVVFHTIEAIHQYTTPGEHIGGPLVVAGSFNPKVSNVQWIEHHGPVVSVLNEAIRNTFCEYFVIMHDDALLLPQASSTWLTMLLEAIRRDPLMAVSGPLKLKHKCGVDYIDFFCAIFSRAVWEKVGSLSTEFPERGYDVDWCARAKAKGFRVEAVGEIKAESQIYTGAFPIYHKGGNTLINTSSGYEVALHSLYYLPTIQSVEAPSLAIRATREVAECVDVTAHISTKDRHTSTLPLTIQSIAFQTVVPKRLLIFDDGSTPDVFKNTLYTHLLNILAGKGCSVEVCSGGKVGQVKNHQSAMNMASTKYVWRVDDDNSVEPNVLEVLLKHIDRDETVGAVASLVHFPWIVPPPLNISSSGRIDDVLVRGNVQWCSFKETIPVEHLHNSFLVRRSACGPYPSNLSVVGHREETIFSHQIFLNGHKLLVTGEAVTWHLRSPTGGIRSFNDTQLWTSDEEKFQQWAVNRGIKFKDYWLIVLDNGLGDHYAFLHVWPKIKAKAAIEGKTILLAVTYPVAFVGIEPTNGLLSIADAKTLCPDIGVLNVYNFMISNNWTKTLVQAYEAMYGV